MGPINYLALMPQQDFLQDIQGGLQVGSQYRDMQIKRQQQEAAIAAQRQYQTDIEAANAAPTPQAFAALALKYPDKREAFKQSWETLSEGERKDQGDAMSQAYSALLSGRDDIAQQALEKRIQARTNSGLDASAEKNILDMLKTNPTQAKASLGFALSHVSDPKDFAKNFGALGSETRAADKAPAELLKAKADADGAVSDASTKRVTAKYADSKALADLEKSQWDVKKIVADIGFQKESNRIAAMNAAANREGNSLKRQELQLKIDDAITKRDTGVRERAATAEAGAANIDNMLNTVERILKNKSLNAVLGSVEGNAFYPNATMGSMNPGGDGDERADAIALIDTLGSQAFLAQIPNIKGMGALSNAEGEKLQSAFQNLSRKQSESQFRENMKEASRLLNKGRLNLSKSSGVPLGRPDTPAAASSRPPLSSFQGGG